MSIHHRKKQFGQHFLQSADIIQKIVSPVPQDVQGIIEIGPGRMALTQKLEQHGLRFLAIEKDRELIPLLSEKLNSDQFVIADALDIDFKQELALRNFPWNTSTPIWLVSNLPYNVATPLFRKFLELEPITHMTLMFQKEVGLKFLSQTLNSLAALGQTYFEIELVSLVSPKAFWPMPKVDSIVLSFKRRKTPHLPLSEVDAFEAFSRKVFAFNNKKLGNVLNRQFKESLPFQGSDAITQNIVVKLFGDPNLRARNLKLTDLYKLYSELKIILTKS